MRLLFICSWFAVVVFAAATAAAEEPCRGSGDAWSEFFRSWNRAASLATDLTRRKATCGWTRAAALKGGKAWSGTCGPASRRRACCCKRHCTNEKNLPCRRRKSSRPNELAAMEEWIRDRSAVARGHRAKSENRSLDPAKRRAIRRRVERPAQPDRARFSTASGSISGRSGRSVPARTAAHEPRTWVATPDRPIYPRRSSESAKRTAVARGRSPHARPAACTSILTGPAADAERAGPLSRRPAARTPTSELVDELLASPRYGEHAARMWLDVVRYSDSNGFDWDEFRPKAWMFRDYVIRSLNADKPFDQFIREQLAGDELLDGPPQTLAGAGLAHRDRLSAAWPAGQLGAAVQRAGRARTEWMADLVETTGGAFLGSDVLLLPLPRP